MPKLVVVLVIWCDNIVANSLAPNPIFHARTKHIEVGVHFIQEKVKAKQLEVRFVPTEEQVVDVFTKPLAASRFELLRQKLTVEDSPFRLREGVKENY